MIVKDRYVVLRNEEWALVQDILKSHPAFAALQQGSAINQVFGLLAKAQAEKQAAEQQPVQAEPETEQVYQTQGRGMPLNQPIHPPRRGEAAKVSMTQPPVPPAPPQKKKPQFVTRKATKEEEEEETQEPGDDDSDTVDSEELLSEFDDSDF